jgi:hypothetical protein
MEFKNQAEEDFWKSCVLAELQSSEVRTGFGLMDGADFALTQLRLRQPIFEDGGSYDESGK